jgi:hypothetical protein
MNAMAPALSLTQRDAESAVSQALTAAFGFGRRAARAVADVAACNERTALAWLNGTSTPDFVHTMRLMAAVPEFAAEARRLAGMATDLDPELERDLSDFVSRIQRRMAMDR